MHPMKIEHQIAIIYCGTKELLRDIPVEKVREFEADFLEMMEMQHRYLRSIKAGKLTSETEETITKSSCGSSGEI